MLISLQLRTFNVSVCRLVLLSVFPRTLGAMSDKTIEESSITTGGAAVHYDPPVGAFLLNPKLMDSTTRSTDCSPCDTKENFAIIQEDNIEAMCQKFAKRHTILPEKLLNFVTECVKKSELWRDVDFRKMQSSSGMYSSNIGAQKTDVSQSLTADDSGAHLDTSIEERNRCARTVKFDKTLDKEINEDISLSSIIKTNESKDKKGSSFKVKHGFSFVENQSKKNICHKQIVVKTDFEKDALLNIGVRMERIAVKEGDKQAKEAIDDSIDWPLIYSDSEEANKPTSSDNEIVIDMQVLSNPDISIHVDTSLIDLQSDKFQPKKINIESLKQSVNIQEETTSVNARKDISKRRKRTKDKAMPDEESKIESHSIQQSRSGNNPEINRLPPSEAQILSSKETDEVYNIAPLFTEKFDAQYRKGKMNRRKQASSGDPERPKKEPPNYFVAIQISSNEILDALRAIQQSIIASNVDLAAAMVAVPTTHLTLYVMHLADDEEIQRATGALTSSISSLPAALRSPIEVEVSGLGHFRDQVLFAEVVPGGALDRLHTLAESVAEKFQEINIPHTHGTAEFNPHITIAKLSKSPQLRRKGIKKIDKAFYEEFVNSTFGRDVITSVQLCSMVHRKEESGYYHVVHEEKLESVSENSDDVPSESIPEES